MGVRELKTNAAKAFLESILFKHTSGAHQPKAGAATVRGCCRSSNRRRTPTDIVWARRSNRL